MQGSFTTVEFGAGGFAADCGCALCSAAPVAEQAARAGGVPVDSVPTDADQAVDGLIGGVVWTTTALTYSFPDSASDFPYRGHLNVRDGFSPATVAMAEAARTAFAFYESVSGLRFAELSGAADRDADLTLARSTKPATAFAYFPHSANEGGDAWFNARDYNDPAAGDYAWATVFHEIGHALGLKHGHETGGAGAVPAAFDSHEFTLMTYRSYVGSAGTAYTNARDGGPQTAMMLDIAAIQRLYGANYGFRAGDDVYAFTPDSGRMRVNGALEGATAGNVIFRTVWDGGGEDRYDFSAYATALRIDLAPGGFVDLDFGGSAQRAALGGGVSARGHVFNALLFEGDARSLIEHATAGAGDDALSGNAADNRLEGGAGSDTLAGLGGDDTLAGGTGADLFLLEAGAGGDLLLDLDFAAGDAVRLEGFSDGTFADGFFAAAGILTDGEVRLDSAADLETVARSTEVELVGVEGHAALEFASGGRVVFATLDFALFAPLAPEAPEALEDEAEARVAPEIAPEPEIVSVTAATGMRLAGRGSADRMAGSSGDDRLIGRAGDDRLSGRGGEDALLGQNGDDRLLGGAGGDALRGGAGADRLVGGAGADRLEGGAGADLFIFAGASGADRIEDFRPGSDRILFHRADDFAALEFAETAEGVLVFHAGGSALLAGLDADRLDASDFLFG